MKHFPYVGPGIVVLVAGGFALVAAPALIRRVNDAEASNQIVNASNILAQPAEQASRGAQSAIGGPVHEGVRDPLSDEADELGYAKSAPGKAASASESQNLSDRDGSKLSLLEQMNRANRAIARLVEPSVVHVSASNTMRRRGYVAPYASSGSGWIWDDAGHIVTNAHVVDGADRLQVQFFDGELRDAELVGLDLRTDIAVIKVEPGGIHPSLRGDSSEVEQGDMVYAFGSPFDFRFSMSSGIVSGLGRSTALDNIDYQNFIQTDAAINPGNSGGPLTDVRGRVIGMNTAIATNPGNSVGQAQFAGIGLAIPMAMIDSTVTQIIETGEVRKGFLGVAIINLDEARVRMGSMNSYLDSFRGEGAVIGSVTKGSPADKAGFRAGDIIVAIDGQKSGSDSTARAMISSRRPGDSVRFEVWRIEEGDSDGKRVELTATLAELDISVALAPGLVRSLKDAGLVEIATATEDRAKALGVPFRRGVLIESIDPEGQLASGIPQGSTITAIFDQPVGSLDEMYTRFARAAESQGGTRGWRRMRSIDVPIVITLPEGRVVRVLVPCQP
jgi:serine protease Do